MAGYTFIRWWHHLIPGRVAELRASNQAYMKDNSFHTFRERLIRKGGINPTPSNVATRPDPPGPTYRASTLDKSDQHSGG